MPNELILVTGATGAQGGAVARQLLVQGRRVRILTRNTENAAARRFAQAGAEIVAGDFNDAVSLRAALAGATSVFSMQLSSASEREQGFLLINEARRAQVRQFVHTSVCGTTEFSSFPDWGKGRWSEEYWTAKWYVEEAVRHAGFAQYTILRPVFMMENFIPPKVGHMFPSLRRGEIASAFEADTKLQLVTADDVGRFAVAAISDPRRFNGENIDLAAESPTLREIVGTLSEALSRDIRLTVLSPEQAVASGLFHGWVRSQEWTNVHGYRASLEALTKYGIPLTRLETWARERRDQFQFD